MSSDESVQVASHSRTLGPVAILAVFALGLLTPAIGMMIGRSGGVAAVELRFPARLPGFPGSIEKLESFPSEMDAFLDDHFGFRSELLGLNSRLHVALGASPSPMFLIGKDGWFFQRTMDGVLDQYRGIDRFSQEELANWVRTMERHQSWLARRGIRLLIAVAPSKHSIYPEYLPDWANVVNEKGRYEQILERLDEGSPLEMIDLHTPLREAKLQHRVYHKSDAHWNDLGAHVAYSAIVERIREGFPDVPLVSLDSFDIDWVERPFGVVTLRLNIADSMPEEMPQFRLRSPSLVTGREWPEGAPSGLMDMLHRTQVIESELPKRPGVVFVRDSFATSLSRFAQESFGRTVLIHHGYGGFRRGLVLSQDPDIVIYEISEPGLSWKLRIEP
jgi:hypothetical protein